LLKSTFLHIPGIGADTECQIWKNDILSWDDFLENYHKLQLCSSKKELIHSHIRRSINAYDNKDYQFFCRNMPGRLHWRAYKELKDNCCFLDIETTGLDKHHDEITLIGLYDGKDSRFFVNGKNLEEFKDAVKDYAMIVTFNGKCFDLPFIKAKHPNISFDKFHVDLRFAMRELGYSGGLKRIEKLVGIDRGDELEEVDGFEAVRLWYKYKRGDNSALELLLRYNQADIENLKILMEFTFEKLKEKEFLSVIP